MDHQIWLNERFEEDRARLHAVAYRMLGSPSEAEDAVQEAWLRLNSIDKNTVQNLRGWLTTVVSRVCLDMLRSRKLRREEPIEERTESSGALRKDTDPESEAILADSVGVALLVVLETLTPSERLVFVLHDLFAMTFEEIGHIMKRSPAAAKQLASRARRRVHGSPTASEASRARQHEMVEVFLRAAREGDLEGLLAVLDPDAVIHIEAAARIDAPPEEKGKARELKGAATWAKQFIALSRGARFVQPALIDGSPGLIFAPGGKWSKAMLFTFKNDKVTRVEVVGDPGRLRQFDIAVL
jgi:RNA polymerase sigma-70 factor (ECF subfamily)